MNKLDQNQIICEYWETPITDHPFLWFVFQLYDGKHNYFFFENDIGGPVDPIYVMTIRNRDTVKISDEGDSTLRIFNLLKNKKSSDRKKRMSFKIWNSPLALEANLRLGITPKKYDEIEKFQYLILTQDETIEFVTLEEPKWEIFKNIHLDDLVIQYLKKDPLY